MKTLALRPPAERSEIFSATASAMAITPAAAEKDFWLCWVLMQLFDEPELATCLRFKGGTSLSKCFNLIQRFSEDIDLVLDWTYVITTDPLANRTKSQQEKLNQDINQKAQVYIANKILPKLREVMCPLCQVDIDQNDLHTINIKYPAVFAAGYLRSQIRLEIGSLAAMMPMGIYTVTPYAAEKFPQFFERSSVKVSAITPERTFLEKLTILHAEAHRPPNKLLPSRYSRHYYDSYKLANSFSAENLLRNTDLLREVVEFKQRFYPSSWANYQTARVGSFKLTPNKYHLMSLQKDYAAMEEMIFGERPNFDELMRCLGALEQKINNVN